MDLDGAQWHIPKSKTGAAMDVPPLRSRAARHGGGTHLNKDTLRESTKRHLMATLPRQIRHIASDAMPVTHRQDGTARGRIGTPSSATSVC